MTSRYQNITILSGSQASDPQYRKNAIYPNVDPTDTDEYIITTAGDRLDLLAFDYYGDSSLWWVIASVNNLDGSSLFPPTGSQLRIPVDYYEVVSSFANKNR